MKKPEHEETVLEITARMREYGWDMAIRAPAISSLLRCLADEIDEAYDLEKSNKHCVCAAREELRSFVGRRVPPVN